MNEETLSALRSERAEFPNMFAESVPSDDEIADATESLGIPFPDDYRQFLLEFGGAMVGPFPIFGLRPVDVMGKQRWSVVTMTGRYRNGGVPGTSDWVVFSEDHSGNPVGFDSAGIVWIHDHDFGGGDRLAETFEEYLRAKCLKLE